ncbi:uncharacterized protein HGUI_03338 [Hanseniaspora guilliermondii]|uniref:Uncharacterized protein n=1 Tax=Hanseniaspora guilliermondii TaxID=56406 RepID=A0A1L0B428_9ASCO|nr:uncharacterized protein HGUI_03338 [Hanseniaspora guilliermondii]
MQLDNSSLCDLRTVFNEFGMQIISDNKLAFYQSNIPNVLWKLRNYKHPDILVNEFSRTITLHDVSNISTDIFFHSGDQQKLNEKIALKNREISHIQTQHIGVIQLLIKERQDRLAEIRFADAVSISGEVNALYNEVQNLNKYLTAYQYKILEKEIEVKDLEYISAELLAMEINSIL